MTKLHNYSNIEKSVLDMFQTSSFGEFFLKLNIPNLFQRQSWAVDDH